MASLTPNIVRSVSRHGVLIALVALILFGYLRYENFLGAFNILSVLRYNSMFALVALGMAYVIMTGGIDLSVGSTAALGSVVAALSRGARTRVEGLAVAQTDGRCSPYHPIGVMTQFQWGPSVERTLGETHDRSKEARW